MPYVICAAKYILLKDKGIDKKDKITYPILRYIYCIIQVHASDTNSTRSQRTTTLSVPLCGGVVDVVIIIIYRSHNAISNEFHPMIIL